MDARKQPLNDVGRGGFSCAGDGRDLQHDDGVVVDCWVQ